MLHEYQIQNKVKPNNSLEIYCKLEGLDPLYMLSIAEKRRNPHKPSQKRSIVRQWLYKWVGGARHPDCSPGKGSQEQAT